MPNTIEIAFKHIPYGVDFEHKGQSYTKTSFNRGYYFKDGRKVFRTFKKKILVNTSSEHFDWISKNNI